MSSLVNVYIAVSVGVFAATVYNRYNLYDNYFAFALSYWAEPITNVILYNFCLAIMILFQKLVAALIFGDIKENQKTKILQKLKLKSLEILFMVIILHDQFTFPVYALALGLIVSFILHHLTVLRSQYLINTHNLYLGEHIRLLSFYLVLVFVDFQVLKHSWAWVMSQNNMSIIFSFHILQLFLLLFEPCVKFSIYLYQRFTGYQFHQLDSKLNLIGFIINLPRLIVLNLLGLWIMIRFKFSFFFIFIIIELVVELVQLLKNFGKIRGLSKMMASLPKITRQQIESKKLDDTCMVCFRQIHQGVLVPSCNHIFHNQCLKQWIHKNTNHFCPKCKKPFDFPQDKKQQRMNQRINMQIQIQRQFNNRQQQIRQQQLQQPKQQKQIQQIYQDKDDFNYTGNERKIHIDQQNLGEMRFINAQLIKSNQPVEKKQQPKIYKQFAYSNQSPIYQTRSIKKQKLNNKRLGSMPYGLPHEAVYHRTIEDLVLRNKVKKLGKSVIDFLDNSQRNRMLLIRDK